MPSRFTTHRRDRLRPPAAVPVELRVAGRSTRLELSSPVRFDEASVVSSLGTAPASAYAIDGFSPRNAAKAVLNRVNALRPAIALDTPFYDTRYISPNNIAHLMVDLIPVLLRVKRVLGDEVVFVFEEVAGPFRQLLAHFGIEVLNTRRRVTGRKVEVFLSREIAQHPISAPNDVPHSFLFGEEYDVLSAAVPRLDGYDRIFLSRKDHRSLINKDEAEDLARAHGYRPVYLEDHAIATQIGIACSARDVLAFHGAAMGFLVLNDRLSSVVEILPPNVYHSYFPLALGRNPARYTQVVPSFDLDVQYAGWPSILASKNTPFAVDLGELERVLAGVAAAAPATVGGRTEPAGETRSVGGLAWAE